MKPAPFFAAVLLVFTVSAQLPDYAAEGKAWLAHVRFLASDELEGRSAGTPGYDKAVDYVEARFKAVGLTPAGTAGYRQPVKFENRSFKTLPQVALVRDGKAQPLVSGQDATLSPRSEVDGSIEAGLVFIGHGLSIPEAGWDDLAGVNLRGKVAVYMNAFPPIKVSDNVRSHANTAEERWIAVKRAGAIGMASLPNLAAAPTQPGGGQGRGAGAPAPVIVLADRDVQALSGQTLALSITRLGAERLFTGAGHALAEITQLARDGKQLPRFEFPGTIRVSAAPARDVFENSNVAGLFEGTDPVLKSEVIVMTSHLDHVGFGRAVDGDSLYNGAMDNASGVATMIEIARLLTSGRVTTKRSIMFVAVAAEEEGLLGSRYFAHRPTVPFDRIVANINLDMFLPLFPLKVIEVQGLAESSLGESVRAAAQTLGVEVQTDREPEQNRFIRSDQYSFIRRGIPALAFKFGYEFDSPEQKIRLAWVRERYHQPSDDPAQPLDIEAAAKFNRVIMALLRRVADDASRPTWNADSFFKRFAAK
jgi:hypothetical protein